MNPPIGLSGQALVKWRELWPRLVEGRQVREDEGDLVAAYCIAFAEWADAVVRVESGGLLVKDAKNRVQPSPWLQIRDNAEARMNELAVHLGIVPGNRAPRIADTLEDYLLHVEDAGEEAATSA